MSDALDYLLKVRKEAVGPYFTFLKKAGDHLDNKTRSLLSVITKVDAQTEKGLKQYLARALREGNSADEILDALLVCLPTLGFSKIVWAIDIILEMDIPDFHPDSIGVKPDWHELAAISDIADGVHRYNFAQRACFVNKQGETIRVFDSRCPHQVTNIPMLSLNDTTLTCPKHEWQFDIESGECIAKGNRPLNELEFKIENETLYVFA